VTSHSVIKQLALMQLRSGSLPLEEIFEDQGYEVSERLRSLTIREFALLESHYRLTRIAYHLQAYLRMAMDALELPDSDVRGDLEYVLDYLTSESLDIIESYGGSVGPLESIEEAFEELLYEIPADAE
jgi:hypothetical protein